MRFNGLKRREIWHRFRIISITEHACIFKFRTQLTLVRELLLVIDAKAL